MNLCPSWKTYCALNHSHETCLFHSTEARCPKRKRWALETLDSFLSTPAQRTEAREVLCMSWKDALELEASELEEADCDEY